MQRLLELKQRMSTIRNIQAVTRTLATVSSAKLSRTRGRAAGLRLYSGRMREALHRQQAYLTAHREEFAEISPYLVPHEQVSRVLLLHVSGDRGMCGSYNLSIDRIALRFVERQKAAGRVVQAACKGLKGSQYLRRRTDAEVVYAEGWSRAGVQDEDIDRFYDIVTKGFLSGNADEVYASYTEFYTPLHRVPKTVRLLPVRPIDESYGDGTDKWSYEPDAGGVLDELVEAFVRIQIEEVLLQSYASEQGARMITMEEATERAANSLRDCQLLYNRLRREVITTDLLGVLFASRLREEEHPVPRGGA